MAIAGRREKIVREGEHIVAINTAPVSNLEGITTYSPKVVERPERTAVVDTSYLDYSRLGSHIEGSPYRGVFYSQVVGSDDQLRPQALDAANVNQQYNCYRDYVMRLTSPFSPSVQDEDTKEFIQTAEANMYYMVAPNLGDMFVADVGQANTGIITITACEKLSYTKYSAYRVTLMLVAINDMDRLNDLERKSIRTLYYDESLLDYFNSPFLDEDTKLKYDTAGKVHDNLKEYYLNVFWDDATKTYRIPSVKEQTVFDPMLTDYCRYIGLESINRPATTWRVGALDLTTVQTLWWLLKAETVEMLQHVTRNVKLISAKQFRVHYRMHNIAYTRFSHAFYPFELRPFTNADESSLTPSEFVYGQDTATESFPVPSKQSYVLSDAFYDQDKPAMTTLEQLVYAMISGAPVSVDTTLELAKELRTRPFLSQAYYIPILLTLIQYVRRKPIWL